MLKTLHIAPESGVEVVLNVLIWKLPMPTGCHNSNETARFILAELESAGLEDVGWSREDQEFFIYPPASGC